MIGRPPDPRKKKTLECEFCGNIFTRYATERRRHKHGYCSIKCLVAFRRTPEYTFWPKVQKTKNCWLWNGSMYSNGYGWAAVDKRFPRKSAHRYSWQIHFGKIPNGLLVLHKCDVRNCVNPAHLFLGTHADNTHDAQSKGRLPTAEKPRKRTIAPCRHPRRTLP